MCVLCHLVYGDGACTYSYRLYRQAKSRVSEQVTEVSCSGELWVSMHGSWGALGAVSDLCSACVG